VFSFIGYLEEEIAVGANTFIDLALFRDIQSMEEVYVVGYGTQKKSVITGAIAKIDAEDLEKSTDLRVEQAIQGKAAGVVVMNNSGQPGDNLTVRIRGVGTNGNSDPLYIVDGLPMTGAGMDYLNSSDIASIEVLKDASATSIYGTRGANGVILITTKQGKKNSPISVSYNGFYGVQNAWRKLDLLNSEQYIEIMNEAQFNDGRSIPLIDEATVDQIRQNGWDTDWQEEMYYPNAPKQSHTLTFAGGGDDNTYSSSFSYFSQDGIVAQGKSSFERFNYRLNTTKEFGILKLGSNINLAHINKFGIDGNNQYGLGLIQAINMPSIIPVQYADGTWATPADFGIGMQEITNPVAMLEYHNSKTRVNKVIGNIYADFDLTKDLVFKSNFGGELAYVTDNSYTPLYYIDANHFNDSLDNATTGMNQYTRWNWDNTLTYTKNISQHNITAIIGMTLFKETFENVWGKKQNLIFDDPDKAYLDNALMPEAEAGGGYSDHRLASYFGRVNYNYEEKYLLEALLRVDGSSRFGPDNLYAYFPAGSVGWVISKENFYPDTRVVNFLKLRSSLGQNGNENIPDFAYTTTINNNNIYFYDDSKTMVNGIQPSRYPKPDLLWETSQQFNVGLDMAFLSNILTLTLDFYDKRTKDWLLQESNATYPRLIGNVGPVINAGEVKNYGYEFEFGYKQNVTSELFISAMLTGAANRSEILHIENANGYLVGGAGVHGQGDILRLETGQPLGYFNLIQTDGIFQSQEEIDDYVGANNRKIQPQAKPGDIKFIDTDSSGSIDDGDRVNVGSPYPEFTMGLNLTLEWKGIDFSMFWYTAIGHQIYLANRRSDLRYPNHTTDVLNRWTEETPSMTHPRVTLSDPNGNYKKASDYYLYDADYVRLKNLTLGYTFPSQLTKKLKIRKFRMYVTGENLLTYTKYPGMEVEVGGGPLGIGIDHGVYPQAKSVLFGLQVVF
jgi:TonB-linked SusC/RagA family outer membrane protein